MSRRLRPVTTFRTEYSGGTNCFVIFYYLDCTKCKFPDFSQYSIFSLTFNKIPWLLPSLEFPWLFPDRWKPCNCPYVRLGELVPCQCECKLVNMFSLPLPMAIPINFSLKCEMAIMCQPVWVNYSTAVELTQTGQWIPWSHCQDNNKWSWDDDKLKNIEINLTAVASNIDPSIQPLHIKRKVTVLQCNGNS